MSKNTGNKDTRILRRRKQKIKRRLKRKQWEEQEHPMLRGSNIHYEMGERNGAINCGGIGVFHQMVKKIGLIEEIDAKVELLKMHVPYHESDHVLNIAYNILVGGMRLEDREVRRPDGAFMDALGAQRIPDPTTAGDFTRRFKRGRYRDADGVYKRGETAGMERRKRRSISGGDDRHRGDNSADVWGMQRGGGYIVQGDMGVCAVNHITGQYERGCYTW